MRIVAPIPQQGGPRIPKNPIFLKNLKTQERLEICQNKQYALRPQVSNQLGSVVSTLFCKAKSAKKNYIFVQRVKTSSIPKCSNLRPLLSITFPQGFRISNNIEHPTSGSGGKKKFKGIVHYFTMSILKECAVNGHQGPATLYMSSDAMQKRGKYNNDIHRPKSPGGN